MKYPAPRQINHSLGLIIQPVLIGWVVRWPSLIALENMTWVQQQQPIRTGWIISPNGLENMTQKFGWIILNFLYIGLKTCLPNTHRYLSTTTPTIDGLSKIFTLFMKNYPIFLQSTWSWLKARDGGVVWGRVVAHGIILSPQVPIWLWIFDCFGFGIGIFFRDTGLGTRAWQFQTSYVDIVIS